VEKELLRAYRLPKRDIRHNKDRNTLALWTC
jgi:hypothetical protein